MTIERTFNNKVRMDKQNKFKLRSVSIRVLVIIWFRSDDDGMVSCSIRTRRGVLRKKKRR